MAWKADSLVMESNGNALALALDPVTKLEVSRGRKSFGAGRGALIGGLVGAASGAIIGAANYEEPPPCVPKALFDCSDFLGWDRVSPTAAQAAVQWAAFGAVAGYAIGRLLGSAMKTERWEEVPLDRLRLSLGPQRDGRLGLGASVSF